ncbi:MAG: aminoacyl-tRNA hydrolase [Sporomusaceae bacterium]|nr:aminoacyl-tRNA hydrolase [Sporomusaceae bacterium]
MKLVIGLGNPGREYEATRHNIGFMAVDRLAKRWETPDWRRWEEALITEQRFQAEKVILVKPQTYMNLSGVAVRQLANFYKIDLADMLVIYDDMDLAVGKLRFRAKGSSGGHRGIESMIVELGDNHFSRLKVGISHPGGRRKVVDHVLTPFTPEESEAIEAALARSEQAVEAWLQEGITVAMNGYNKNE